MESSLYEFKVRKKKKLPNLQDRSPGGYVGSSKGGITASFSTERTDHWGQHARTLVLRAQMEESLWFFMVFPIKGSHLLFSHLGKLWSAYKRDGEDSTAPNPAIRTFHYEDTLRQVSQ